HNTINNFYFRIDYNDFKEGDALLDKPEGYVTQGRGHTLYKGTRESNGLLLEEWIAKGQFFLNEDGSYSDDWGYVFSLGIHMTDPTYKTPQLRLEMYYKIPDDETQAYSEKQLMVIWREITNSIRIRGSAFENE
ncbi:MULTISPECIES: T6SS immunity protein Tli4 family protein, partial [unclassified Gilliamella]|uniref:T6SS immunity protein Tli4 family protein n=1 Tax=unclassified Gilliamella TaxID=2685620 RepID=UPI00132C3569